MVTEQDLAQAMTAGNGQRESYAESKILPAGWATPRAEDWESSGMRHTPGVADTLTAQATHLAGWPACTATDAIKGGQVSPRPGMMGLSETVSGLTPDGSSAATESTAAFQLNPRFSLWLMGFPTSWHDAGAFALRSLRERETPSSPKSLRNSSKPSSNPDET
jgi:hypothetical protein